MKKSQHRGAVDRPLHPTPHTPHPLHCPPPRFDPTLDVHCSLNWNKAMPQPKGDGLVLVPYVPPRANFVRM